MRTTSHAWKAISVALILGVLALAPAASAQSSQDDSSSGQCTMSGHITFDNPVGVAPVQNTFTDRAAGTCTGTVNGVFMANERVYLHARGSGLLGCSASQVTDDGTFVYTRNTATRSDDVYVDYTAHSQGAFGNIASRIEGRVSGEGVGVVQFHGDQTTLEQCQQGTYRGGDYDTTGQSITPLVG